MAPGRFGVPLGPMDLVGFIKRVCKFSTLGTSLCYIYFAWDPWLASFTKKKSVVVSIWGLSVRHLICVVLENACLPKGFWLLAMDFGVGLLMVGGLLVFFLLSILILALVLLVSVLL